MRIADQSKRKRHRRDILLILSFLLPALVSLGVLMLGPVIYAIRNSLYEWSLLFPEIMKFVGLRNYQEALFGDPIFWTSLKITFLYALGGLLPIALGLLLAVLLSGPVWGKNVVLSILLIPMIMAPVAVGLIWKVFFWEPAFGWVNMLLGLVGIRGPIWLSEPGWVLVAVILTGTWKWVPFVMLILHAAITRIPEEPFEAAKLDGATRWQTFGHITLPMIRVPLAFVLLVRVSTDLRFFDTVYIMTEGGPGTSSLLLSIEVYRVAFREFRLGYANTLATVLFIIITGVCMAIIFGMGRKKIMEGGLWEQSK